MLSLQELSKLMPLACGLCPHEKLVEERKRDLISHFILRLAFCKTPEQTKWFIQHEIELFKYRFQLVGCFFNQSFFIIFIFIKES